MKNHSTGCKNTSGFTLLELMITIAIAAILAGIATLAYNYYIKEAQETVIEEAVSEMHHAAAVYVAAYGKTPQSMKDFGFPDNAAGLDFKLIPDTTYVNQAQILAFSSPGKTPFAINIASESRSLCWDCVPADQAGKNVTDIDTDFYVPVECRTVSPNRGCSSTGGKAQSGNSSGNTGTGTPGTNGAMTPPQTIAQQDCASDPGKEIVTIGAGSTCLDKCPKGQMRDPQNLTGCIADPSQQTLPTCATGQVMIGTGGQARCVKDCTQVNAAIKLKNDPNDENQCIPDCGSQIYDEFTTPGITGTTRGCFDKACDPLTEYRLPNGTCTAKPVCSNGQVLNQATLNCETVLPVCTAGQYLAADNKCHNNPTCSNSQTVATDSQTGMKYCEERCPANDQSWDGSACKCNGGLKMMADNSCGCNADEDAFAIPFAGVSTCLPKCTQGQTRQANGTCACPAGTVEIQGICLAECKSNQYRASSGWCYNNPNCSSSQTVETDPQTGKKSCQNRCTAGLVWNGQSCGCAPGKDLVGNQCLSQCTGGMSRQANGSCACSGTQENIGGQCLDKCPDHQTRHLGACTDSCNLNHGGNWRTTISGQCCHLGGSNSDHQKCVGQLHPL